MMKTPFVALMLCLVGSWGEAAPLVGIISPEPGRAFLGVVPSESSPELLAHAGVSGGVVVQGVGPTSPAARAGLHQGDLILSINGKAVSSRAELKKSLSGFKPGDSVQVEILSCGIRRVATVVLAEHSGLLPQIVKLDDAVGGDRQLRRQEIPEKILRQMRELRQQIAERLALLPEPFQGMEVTELLQSIRHLARDANPDRADWMPGQAGEVSLLFKDDQGSLMLHGANKLLTLKIYDFQGRLLQSYSLDTPDQRCALPPDVLERLRKLR